MRNKTNSLNSEAAKKEIRHIATSYPNWTIKEIFYKMKQDDYNVTFACVRAVTVHARKLNGVGTLGKSLITKPFRLKNESHLMKTEVKKTNMIDMAAFQDVHEEVSKHENYLEIVERMSALSLLVDGNENLINWVRFISNKGVDNGNS